MKEFYKINGDYAEIMLLKEIYPLISVQKALYNYLESTFVKLEDDSNYIKIKIKVIDTDQDIDVLIGQILNECLRETIRYNIFKETKNLRELIVGRALYSTCIDLEEHKSETNKIDNLEETEEDKFNIDDIAVNWFDKNIKDENK